MNTIQLSIEASESDQEILVAKLSEAGAAGFEQTDTHLLAYFNELDFDSYEVNRILQGFSFITGTVPEKNWNDVWESNFQPVIVDRFCGIRADFHAPLQGVQHEIIITPKMSFGTGHHATTHMMISQMEGMDFTGKKVFDFGTGTGILAILAEKLGAASISAIDVDHWSMENARENAVKNDCHRIQLELTSVLPDEKFDIILANINRNVILQYLPQLPSRLHEKSLILFSGLLDVDENDIVQACQEQGLKLLRQQERNHWISLLFIK